MKKSIGTKVASVLSFLAVILVVAITLCIAALTRISELNHSMKNYLELQSYVSPISIAVQENKAVLDKVYFNDSGEEYEARKEEVFAGFQTIEENLVMLRESCQKLNDAETSEMFGAWDAALCQFQTDVTDFFGKIDQADYVNAKFLMDEFSAQEETIRQTEEAFDTFVYNKAIAQNHEASLRINGTVLFALIEAGAFFVVILAGMTVILRTVAAPAKKTKGALEAIVTGIREGEGDLTERVPVVSKDEIGRMSQGINGFIQQLQQIMQKLKTNSDQLLASAELVKMKTDASNESANNVSATTEEMSASMEEISATLAQIAEGNASVVQDVKSMYGQAADGATLVTEIKERAKEIYTSTLADKNRTAEMIEKIRAALRQAMEESRSVTQIQELTKEILSITGQTNLLSLNASIEAARAGEAGRGFAVVAGEISHLADNSRETANNIQHISEMVTAAVEKLVKNAEEVLQFIDEKVMADYDGFVEVTGQYEKDADDMNSILQEFANRSSVINDTMLALDEGIDSVHIAMDENARGVADVAQNVVNLVESIGQIQMETETNLAISQKLDDEVQRFKKV